MSEFIQGFQTTEGEKKYDYNALGNLPDLSISKEDITGALGFVPPSKAEVQASVQIASDAAATADNKAVAAQSTANQAVGAAQQAQSTADGAVLAAQNAQNRADDAHERIDDSYSQIVQGSIVTIDDCDNAPLQNLRIFGKTTQKTTTGKNLYGFEEITFTRRKVVYLDNPLPAGTYAVSAVIVSNATNTSTCIATFLNEDNSSRKTLTFSRNTRDVEILTTNFPVAEIWFMASTSYDGSEGYTATWSQLQIEAGSTPTDYEPYTGGIPSPNPDFPQPLESIGDSGIVDVTVAGKNLMPYPYNNTTKTVYGITFTDNGDGTVTANGTATANADFYLHYSFKVKAGMMFSIGVTGSGTTYELFINGLEGTIIHCYSQKSAEKDFNANIFIRIRTGTTVNNLIFKPQIELNTDATPYEQYKTPQTLTVQKPAEVPVFLPGIPVTSGGNHTDENGQQWVCDVVDFARGKYVQRVGEHTFDGTETITDQITLENYSWHSISMPGAKNLGYVRDSGFISTLFPFCGGDGLQNDFGAHRRHESLFFSCPLGETAKEFIKDSTVLFELAEPIEHDLTAEELAQYAALYTNYPNTTIFNDAGADTEVKYATPDTAVPISGARMAGDIDMCNHRLTGIPDPVDSNDAANKKCVDNVEQMVKVVEAETATAKQIAEGADAKVEKLREVVSKFHSNIVETAIGDVIAVSDASDMELAGLRIFGKTIQNGTPTPEAPVPLESVGDSGSVGVTVAGKNLIPYPYQITTETISGITFTDNGDGTVTANGTATENASFKAHVWSETLLPEGEYVLSGCPAGGGYGTYRINIALKNAYNDNMIDTAEVGLGLNIKLSKTATKLYLTLMVNAGQTVNNLVFHPMLESGNISTAYEPHREGQYLTVQTPNNLPGIPVTSGGNYTDENGQQWICDEVDFARGKYVQAVCQLTFDGSDDELWAFVASNDNGISTFSISPGVGHKLEVGLSNYAQLQKAVNSNTVANGGFRPNGTYIYLYTETSKLSTVEELRSRLAETNMVVYVALNEPIEHDLTAEELAQYAALHTNYPNTTIYNDGGANMEVKYVADTKMYIDKKFEELAEILVNKL